MKDTVKGLLTYAAIGGALVAGIRVASDLYDSISNNVTKIKNKISKKINNKKEAQ